MASRADERRPPVLVKSYLFPWTIQFLFSFCQSRVHIDFIFWDPTFPSTPHPKNGSLFLVLIATKVRLRYLHKCLHITIRPAYHEGCRVFWQAWSGCEIRDRDRRSGRIICRILSSVAVLKSPLAAAWLELAFSPGLAVGAAMLISAAY